MKNAESSKFTMIRRAKPEDARAIHDAHMLSIQTICSKDHSAEEIRAWGGRSFNEAQRLAAIQNQHVWVVEVDGQVEGYGHLRIDEKDGIKLAHIMGLYFTPKAVGKKFGRAIFQMMLNEAKACHATKVSLESTLTSHEFYKKMGFHDEGGLMTLEIAGIPIRCIPMAMRLEE